MWQNIQSVLRFSARVAPGIKQIVPDSVFQTAREVINDRAVGQEEDRKYLVDAILPFLAKRNPSRVLFVGCQSYTRRYPEMFAGAEFWTMDIDPQNAKWGSPLHKICDVATLAEVFSAEYFDQVIINGVFGWGVDSDEAIGKTLHGAARTLCPNGILMIGWDRGRCSDPLNAPAMQANFNHVGLGRFPSRTTFSTCVHVFDFCVRMR